MGVAPLPAPEQLEALSAEMGTALEFVERLAGGLSCTTDVLETGDRVRLVLRRHRPWRRKGGIDSAARERFVLDILARSGVPVPAAVWTDTGRIFAEPAIVIEFVEGRPELEPGDPHDWAEQLAGALVEIHAVPVDETAIRHLPAGPPEETVGDDGRFDAHPDGRRLRLRLHELRRSASIVPPTLIHGDFWPGNALWNDGRLAAVIDWEEAAVADPAADVAYCASDMRYIGLDAAADYFVSSYTALSGRELETFELWHVSALCRPLPDIALWLPAWESFGLTDIDPDELRAKHRDLVAEALRH